ncbi:ferredoxin reductase [Skermania piniformis]|uniref:Ferredoxin reductase n=1 Tax=Skermania pinensis TaxID=39122 RepID=A0ABX8S6T4_9ACTN|nr:ferredoxin reductase [Skermania piniformis]QXQ12882.1 ferredoxin reductase [Skermania piniformis]
MTSVLPRRIGGRLLALAETLATPHQLDRYLELVDPMVTARDLRAEVTEVRRQTADTVSLTLRPTWQWAGFAAGQFVQLGVVVDGIRHTRCYSPASSQYRADGRIELTIKAQADGIVSQYLYRYAEPGMVVSLSQASGTFRLPAVRPERVLLVSGGSGITPVLSMLRTLADEDHDGEIVFLHYAYTRDDVPHRTELDRLAAAHRNVRVVYAYTEGDARPGELTGFFGHEHLRTVAPWYADAQTFLCGPPGLMRGVREVYRELGVDDRLHTEEFAPAPVAPVEAGGTITFSGSAVTADNDGTSLLEQAEAAGLSPEYGCRMGICFSCTAIKRTGCTRNLRTGETDADPDQPIQLCVSAPVGDVDIDI